MPKKKRDRLYDLVTGTPRVKSNDPLDMLLEEEAKNLALDARRLRLEEIVESRKQKLARVREKTPLGSFDDSNQLLGLMKMMNEQLQTGVKIAQGATGQKTNTGENLALFKIFSDLLVDSIKKPLEQALSQGQQKSFMEQMILDPTMFSRVREMGIFGGKESEANSFAVQIEQLRGERDLQNRKFELELQKDRLKRDSDMQKLGMVLGTLNPLMNMGAEKFSQEIQQRGRDFGRPSPNPGHNPNTSAYAQSELAEIHVQCDQCGYSKVLGLPDPPPSTISCPSCKTPLRIGIQEEEVSEAWVQDRQNF